MSKELMGLAEAAEYLGYKCSATIAAMLKSGKLKGKKIETILPQGNVVLVWQVSKKDLDRIREKTPTLALISRSLKEEGYVLMKEACRITGLSRGAIRHKASTGQIRAKKISQEGGNFQDYIWAFNQEDLNKINKRSKVSLPKTASTKSGSKKKEEDSELTLIKRELSRIRVETPREEKSESKTVEDKNVLGKRTLVVPDIHAKPGVSNERMSWLGNLILDLQPDIVEQLGDFGDMESLSSYDKGKRSFEGRRYVNDVKSVIDAQEKLFKVIEDHNRPKKESEKFKARWVYTRGNHEERINRATNDDPMLDGVLSVDDLSFQDFGWEVYNFLDVVEIEGIFFSHYFPSGLMGKPIGGMFPARSLNNKLHRSCIAGHSHVFDYDTQALPSGQRINSMVAGCYFEHEETYVSRFVQQMWWRGVVLLDNCRDGNYSIRQIPMEEIKHRYG